MSNWWRQCNWMGSLGMGARHISASRKVLGCDRLFDSERTSVEDLAALLLKDVSGFLNEFRSGHSLNEMLFRDNGQPYGCMAELADAVIRIAELCAVRGMDIDQAIRDRMNFNAGEHNPKASRSDPYSS